MKQDGDRTISINKNTKYIDINHKSTERHTIDKNTKNRNRREMDMNT